MTAQFSVFGVPNIPMIEHGDCLSDIILQALDNAGLTLQAGDVVCLAQKIVSKAEGRMLALSSITQPRSRRAGNGHGKRPAHGATDSRRIHRGDAAQTECFDCAA